MLEIIKHSAAGVLLIVLFVIGINANNAELYATSWLISGIYALAIGSGSDPNNLLGSFNIFGRLTLIIGCIISGILALIVLITVEWVNYLQEIEED